MRRMLLSGTTVSRPAGRVGGGRCGRRRRRCRRRLPTGGGAVLGDVRLHVGAGDSPTDTSAGDLRGVQPVLSDQPAHNRRQHESAAAGGGSTRRLWRSRIWRSRCRLWWRRRWRSYFCYWLRRGRRRFGRRRGSRPVLAQNGDHRAHFHRVSLGGHNLHQHPGHGRGNLGVHLVGGHLKERLVFSHLVAHLLVPLDDGALHHRLAQLWHPHLRHRASRSLFVSASTSPQCRARPVSASTDSPNSSLMVGWGWMNSATSGTVASQFTAR